MVPRSLRIWFVIHFIVDYVFALPLLFAPVAFMTFFGWQTIDPFMTRLVAAALLGIGGASYLGRNASADTFREMLNLKIIWSGGALVGMVATLLPGDAPPTGWLIVGIFVLFNVAWVTYRLRLQEK